MFGGHRGDILAMFGEGWFVHYSTQLFGLQRLKFSGLDGGNSEAFIRSLVMIWIIPVQW